MSVPEPPEPQRKSGSLLLAVLGVILLLPGICAVFSALGMAPWLVGDPGSLVLMLVFWAVCLAISYGGIKLIQLGSGG